MAVDTGSMRRPAFSEMEDAGAREAKKGAGRMPWLTEATKDAASCENPGEGAHGL